MTLYLTFSNENNAITAESQISDNADLPNNAGTVNWLPVKKAVNEDIWFFPAPPENGWWNVGCQHFTYAQLMNGVANFVIQEFNPAWEPPIGEIG